MVCEGQLDLIACYLAGVQNVVAPQGTALTADHARVLRRYVSEVVLCFDSDTAGQRAAVRALDDLLTSGLAIRVATIPAPHDPDSYIRAFGAEAFRQLIAGARGFFDYYLDRLAQEQDMSSDRGRTLLVRALGEAVQKTANAVLIDTYAQKAAHRLGVNIEAVRAEFRKLAASPRRAADEAAEPPAEPARAEVPRPSAPEFWLLKLLLPDDELLDWARDHLRTDWIQHPAVRRIVEARLEPATEGKPSTVAALLHQVDDPAAQSLMTEAVAERRQIPNRAQQLADVARRLRDQSVDSQMAALARRLADPALAPEEQTACQREREALRLVKQQPV